MRKDPTKNKMDCSSNEFSSTEKHHCLVFDNEFMCCCGLRVLDKEILRFLGAKSKYEYHNLQLTEKKRVKNQQRDL